ncbi:MAG: hypothetical protein SF066_05090 [Thermoanaerobaculia bacterium]|nr:hypothetical protein [Thermoanaerobaculia bacterium]
MTLGIVKPRTVLPVALLGALLLTGASVGGAQAESSEESVSAGAVFDEFDALAMTRPNGKVKKEGESEVPGTGGKKVKWKITAKKNGSKSAQVWIDVKNPGSSSMKFVICAMINLKGHGTAKHDLYKIEPDGRGGYKCTKTGCADMAPSFHLGCKTVTLSGGGSRNVFDRTVTFSTAFANEDIESVYFDLLTYGSLPSGGGCGAVVGANKFLYPSSPAGNTSDWANIWGGGGGPTTLATAATVGFQATYVASVPVGNWVTMGYPGTYPSVLEAVVEGAPAGTQVRVVTQGVAGPVYKVEAGPDGGCVGLPLDISEPFTITPEVASNEIYIGFPEGECSQVAEGATTSVWGNVYATDSGDIYKFDDFMYGVSYLYTHDTAAPEILTVANRQEGSGLRIEVSARDAATMPVAATFQWSSDDGESGEVPLNFAPTAMVGDVAYFSDVVTGLPMGQFLDCQVVVYDESDNAARSAVVKVIVVDPATGQRPRPPRFPVRDLDEDEIDRP